MGNVCSGNTASGSKFSRSLLICVELQLAILTVLVIKKGEDIAAIIVTPPPPPPPRACELLLLFWALQLFSFQLNSNPSLVQDGVPDMFTLGLSSVKVGVCLKTSKVKLP